MFLKKKWVDRTVCAVFNILCEAVIKTNFTSEDYIGKVDVTSSVKNIFLKINKKFK